MTRYISVSTGAYDGYEPDEILASLHRCNVQNVELAFIKGYVNEFSDADLNPKFAAELRNEMQRFGQRCLTFSGHINLGDEEALSQFRTRVAFARETGAVRFLTNSSTVATAERFFRLVPEITAIARDAGMVICLENPGDGVDNLFNSAADIPGLLEKLDREVFSVNYDAGNLVSHRPQLDVIRDTLEAVPYADHLHVKDVIRTADGYRFCALGEGDIDYRRLLAAVSEKAPDLSFSLELPFRLRRTPAGKPYKEDQPLPLAVIEDKIKQSIRFVDEVLKP